MVKSSAKRKKYQVIYVPTLYFQGYALGTHSKLSAYGRANMPIVWDFVCGTFDEFERLSPDDKVF